MKKPKEIGIKKVWVFLDEWKYVIFCAMFIIAVASMIAYEIARPKINEGMVMNKWISPAYKSCDDDGCTYRSTKYIIAVQDGDLKDWWYVTENYYDTVKIGDWVTK